MATVTSVLKSGAAALEPRSRLMTVDLDFAETSVPITDTVQLFTIPARTWVKRVGYLVTRVATEVTMQFSIGDDDAVDTWFAAVAAFGALNSDLDDLDGVGKFYAAADTIDLVSSVAANLSGKIFLWAEILDLRDVTS